MMTEQTMNVSAADDGADTPTQLALYIGAFFDELARGGVKDVVVSPGSRSTPLSMMAYASTCMLMWMREARLSSRSGSRKRPGVRSRSSARRERLWPITIPRCSRQRYRVCRCSFCRVIDLRVCSSSAHRKRAIS